MCWRHRKWAPLEGWFFSSPLWLSLNLTFLLKTLPPAALLGQCHQTDFQESGHLCQMQKEWWGGCHSTCWLQEDSTLTVLQGPRDQYLAGHSTCASMALMKTRGLHPDWNLGHCRMELSVSVTRLPAAAAIGTERWLLIEGRLNAYLPYPPSNSLRPWHKRLSFLEPYSLEDVAYHKYTKK